MGYREGRADTEDQDGNHENIEIELQPLAKRVADARQSSGASKPDQKDDLVASVGGRVDRLRHHGGRASEQSGT